MTKLNMLAWAGLIPCTSFITNRASTSSISLQRIPSLTWSQLPSPSPQSANLNQGSRRRLLTNNKSSPFDQCRIILEFLILLVDGPTPYLGLGLIDSYTPNKGTLVDTKVRWVTHPIQKFSWHSLHFLICGWSTAGG